MHQSGLRDLKGLLNYSMSFVFTFLCAINQVKALSLDKTLDFHMNLIGEKRIIFDLLDIAMKNALIENNLEEVNDHALAFGAWRQVHTSDG